MEQGLVSLNTSVDIGQDKVCSSHRPSSLELYITWSSSDEGVHPRVEMSFCCSVFHVEETGETKAVDSFKGYG